MRKIQTKEELERRSKRNSKILSLVMFFVLVGGTAGYAFLISPGGSNPPENENVNKFELLNPVESVADIPVEITRDLNSYAGSKTYIVSKNGGVTAEISKVMLQFTTLQEACFGPCEENLPEKDCSENLIIWEESMENKVYEDGKCVFIEGDMRAVDAFLYKILGQ